MKTINNLQDYSTSDLEEEITRRKRTKPVPRSDYSGHLDWYDVYHYIRDTVDGLDEGNGLPDDFEQTLMEAVINTIYNEHIWDWWRSKC